MPWAEKGLRYVQFDNLYVVNSKMSVKPHRFVIIHRCVSVRPTHVSGLGKAFKRRVAF